MAGATCPKCGNKTLFNDNRGKSCTRCDFFVEIPVAKGRGRRCVICGKYQVGENGVCRDCGAKHNYGED
ncbi:MAG: hypothetical protein ACRDA0_00325 [Cetobacterium sp.]|uniref:hypothetical protein n=1 Tax=Cetobacterium sp. TaxID=2071632 RepID=UPI002FCBD766